MHPTILFPFIHSYGLMLAVGFYAAWWLGARRARAEGISSDVIGNMVLISILAGVVGARLLWFALHRRPGDSPWVIIEVWKGGLVFYGGLLAAAVADFFYLRKARQDVWRVADVVAPAVAVGQAFGRLGCFLNGCCYGGTCTDSFRLGVRFPAFLDEKGAPTGSAVFLDHVARHWVPDDAAASLAVHPTQLYEAASLFMIAALITVARPFKRRHGELFALLCILNGVSRFGVELVRRDTPPAVLGLNPGQLGAIVVLALGTALLLWARRRGGAAAISHPA